MPLLFAERTLFLRGIQLIKDRKKTPVYGNIVCVQSVHNLKDAEAERYIDSGEMVFIMTKACDEFDVSSLCFLQ